MTIDFSLRHGIDLEGFGELAFDRTSSGLGVGEGADTFAIDTINGIRLGELGDDTTELPSYSLVPFVLHFAQTQGLEKRGLKFLQLQKVGGNTPLRGAHFSGVKGVRPLTEP